MKCKIFNEDVSYLEDSVNEWLESEKIVIVNTIQTMDGNDNVILTIFYLTENELRRRKLDNLNDANQ